MLLARSRPGRHRAPWVALALATMLVATLSTTTYGFSTSVAQTLLKSRCDGKITLIHWRGGNPGTTTTYPYGNEPNGTVVVCYYKYRLASAGPDGDYYGIEVVSTWSPAASLFPFDQATMRQYGISNTDSKDQVYDSTPSFTSSRSCTSPFTVSVNVGPFSVSTTPELCSGHTVTVINPGSTGATWQCTQAAYLRIVDTGFVQKVRHGVVPQFWVSFQIPYYIYTHQPIGDPWKITPDWIYYNYSGI